MTDQQLRDKLREQALRAIYPDFTTLEAYDKKACAADRRLDDQRGRTTDHPMDWFYDSFRKEQ